MTTNLLTTPTNLSNKKSMTSGEVGLMLAVKKYGLIVGAILWGATAFAITDIKKNGWKGFWWLIADVFVAGFIGALFAHLASLTFADYITVAGGLGGYMGPAAFKYIRRAALNKIGLADKSIYDEEK
jgi:hypothetical protein